MSSEKRTPSEIEKFLCNEKGSFGDITEINCGDFTQLLPVPFDQNFQIVNGTSCPNGAVACGQEKCSEFQIPQIINLIAEEALKAIRHQKNKEYITGRRLNGSNSYNSELNLIDSGIQKILELHSQKLSDKKLFISDNGCGGGFADKELTELSFVDTVYGTTLPVESDIYGPNVLFANSLNLKTRAKKEFDVSMSIHGFTCYNPFKNIFNGLHSIARLINFTKIGGLYIDTEGNTSVSGNHKYKETHELLVKIGIIKHHEPANELARSKSNTPPIFEILNHLTIQKIKQIINEIQ